MILARRESPGLFAGLVSAMGEAGGVPDDVLEVAEMQTIISLVAGGFGVSLVPASVGQVDRSGVAFRPIAGPTPTIELALAWRAVGRLAGPRRVHRGGSPAVGDAPGQGAIGLAPAACSTRRGTAPRNVPLNVQGLRGNERGFTGALHGEERKPQP